MSFQARRHSVGGTDNLRQLRICHRSHSTLYFPLNEQASRQGKECDQVDEPGRVKVLKRHSQGSPPDAGSSLPHAGVTLRGRVRAADRDQSRAAPCAVDAGERTAADGTRSGLPGPERGRVSTGREPAGLGSAGSGEVEQRAGHPAVGSSRGAGGPVAGRGVRRLPAGGGGRHGVLASPPEGLSDQALPRRSRASPARDRAGPGGPRRAGGGAAAGSAAGLRPSRAGRPEPARSAAPAGARGGQALG